MERVKSTAAWLGPLAAALVLGPVHSDRARASEATEYEEIGHLDCEVTGWRNLIVYSAAEFTCRFDALDERYKGRASKGGFNLKWKLGETVRFKVFTVKKKAEAHLSTGALGGKYREMDFGLGVGLAADFSLPLMGGTDDDFVLQAQTQVGTGLGITWTLGSLRLEPLGPPPGSSREARGAAGG
jgi:hypothetical protein